MSILLVFTCSGAAMPMEVGVGCCGLFYARLPLLARRIFDKGGRRKLSEHTFRISRPTGPRIYCHNEVAVSRYDILLCLSFSFFLSFFHLLSFSLPFVFLFASIFISLLVEISPPRFISSYRLGLLPRVFVRSFVFPLISFVSFYSFLILHSFVVISLSAPIIFWY